MATENDSLMIHLMTAIAQHSSTCLSATLLSLMEGFLGVTLMTVVIGIMTNCLVVVVGNLTNCVCFPFDCYSD